MRRWWLVSLLLMVAVGFCAFAFAQEVVVEDGEGATALWQALLPLFITAVIAVVSFVKGGKYKRYLQAAIDINRTVYSAVEEADAHDVKDLVKDVINKTKSKEIKEVNELITSVVDEKKAASEEVPAIKRFWRRFLRGDNLAGVAARVAAKEAIVNYVSKDD